MSIKCKNGGVPTEFPPASENVNYFNWDMESETTSLGPIIGYRGNTVLSTDAAHTGTQSMKMVIIGNDGNNQGLGIEVGRYTYPFDFIGSASVYYRWWMRIDTGFSWGLGTAKTKTSRNDLNGSQGYTGYMYDDSFKLAECDTAGCLLDDGSGNSSGSGITIPHDMSTMADSTFHEYIMRVKPNSVATCTGGVDCDAEFEAFVDGVSIGSYIDFKLNTLAGEPLTEFWGGWMIYPYFQMGGTVDDGGIMYIDDVSVDSTFNSTY